jgi:hypothetical protein
MCPSTGIGQSAEQQAPLFPQAYVAWQESVRVRAER